nr:uncharacterized protein LOC113811802 [Penaeus vannamei]
MFFKLKFTVRKGFDSVQMPAVLEEVYSKILENIYEDGTATITLHTEIDKIYIKGVRQGDNMSPKQFALRKKIKKLEWNGKGVKMGDKHRNNLKFADDTDFFSESSNELQQLINDLNMNRKMTVKFNSRDQFEQIHVQSKVL